ncbi:MAG TPA: hypothetical protein VIS99_05935, partial [Terrimicrobiaceae bacterium]
MGGSEGRDPLSDFQTLRKEIELYDPKLAARPFAVVANKMDLPNADEHFDRFKSSFPKAEVTSVSAKDGEGIERVKEFLANALSAEAENRSDV